MTETADYPEPRPPAGWLTKPDLDRVRAEVPMVYVDAIPVRVNPLGTVTAVGLLLRSGEDDTLSRALVSGRVRHGESVRDALLRLLETDLGTMAFPQLPASLAPITIGEYLPDGSSSLHDPRQHAVSLVYLVPVLGDCQPANEVLSIDWLSPAQATSDEVAAEMVFGQAELVRRVVRLLGS